MADRNLETRLGEIEAKLARWQDELPKLIQPERSHVQNIADLSFLLAALRVARKALERAKVYDVKGMPFTTIESVRLIADNVIAEIERLAEGREK